MLAGGGVLALQSGLCTISATQPGNTTFAAAAAVTRSFAIVAAPQVITFSPAAAISVGQSATVAACMESLMMDGGCAFQSQWSTIEPHTPIAQSDHMRVVVAMIAARAHA